MKLRTITKGCGTPRASRNMFPERHCIIVTENLPMGLSKPLTNNLYTLAKVGGGKFDFIIKIMWVDLPPL
jgi:hypothetical protein